MKTVCLFLFSLLLCSAAYAGNTGEISRMQVNGKVLDRGSLEELAGVEVRIKDTNIVTFTDLDGRFHFENIPAGNYTLEFHLVTYTVEQIIADEPDHQLDLTVEMGIN